jgi:hypothetical protein
VLRQIEHVLRDLYVLDVIEVLLLMPNFVGISEKRSRQTIFQRLQRDDVLAAHRPVGRDDEFWYQAERELSQGVTSDEKSETFLE